MLLQCELAQLAEREEAAHKAYLELLRENEQEAASAQPAAANKDKQAQAVPKNGAAQTSSSNTTPTATQPQPVVPEGGAAKQVRPSIHIPLQPFIAL